jgi:predicted ATPase
MPCALPLLAELASKRYATVEEPARAVIAERLASGESHRRDPLTFAREILHRDIEKYLRRPQSSRWILIEPAPEPKRLARPSDLAADVW